MKVKAELPEWIHGFTYVKNTHFIELEDDEENKTRLIPTSIVKYVCEDCRFVFFSESNFGDLKCPICGSLKAKPQWGKMQLSFLPEEESNFVNKYSIKNND